MFLKHSAEAECFRAFVVWITLSLAVVLLISFCLLLLFGFPASLVGNPNYAWRFSVGSVDKSLLVKGTDGQGNGFTSPTSPLHQGLVREGHCLRLLVPA